jgi:hypothetical protein
MLFCGTLCRWGSCGRSAVLHLRRPTNAPCRSTRPPLPTWTGQGIHRPWVYVLPKYGFPVDCPVTTACAATATALAQDAYTGRGGSGAPSGGPLRRPTHWPRRSRRPGSPGKGPGGRGIRSRPGRRDKSLTPRATPASTMAAYPGEQVRANPPREPNFREPVSARRPRGPGFHPFAFARLRMAVSERLFWRPIQARAISQTAFRGVGQALIASRTRARGGRTARTSIRYPARNHQDDCR